MNATWSYAVAYRGSDTNYQLSIVPIPLLFLSLSHFSSVPLSNKAAPPSSVSMHARCETKLCSDEARSRSRYPLPFPTSPPFLFLSRGEINCVFSFSLCSCFSFLPQEILRETVRAVERRCVDANAWLRTQQYLEHG